MTKKLVIANCSGFYGDRLSAAKEMVTGGHIDVLTGDYLAELTMAILFKNKMKDPTQGYAKTFLTQVEQIWGTCLDRGIRIVSNAGGLNPKAAAEQLTQLAAKLGLSPKIAYVEGDDVLPRLKQLQEAGEAFAHLDRKTAFQDANATALTANAYMGGWGIAEALCRGADMVITGRVTDASLVVGPCAWHFGWAKADWDKLAGAVAAGHLLECGTQVTGGNYCFIDEIPSYHHIGFPIAEMHEDGSFVITKHPDTGGLVSVGTVTAQLVYEIDSPRYLNPDVTAHFDTLKLKQEGSDRVRVSGARGEAPSDTLKVCMNLLGPHRNSATLLLTGLQIEQKAQLVEEQLLAGLGGPDQFERIEFALTRADQKNPASNDQAFAYLKVTVFDRDANKVGRNFFSKLVELALASIPGFATSAPPGEATPTIVYWPTLVASQHIVQRVVVGPEVTAVAHDMGVPLSPRSELPTEPHRDDFMTIAHDVAPLGAIYGARSGDKGGNANVGIWAKTPGAYNYLSHFLTIDRFKLLYPDLAPYPIERYAFSNLRALNFVIRGLLGDGVSSSTRIDPQAKTLGEYIRARIIEIPKAIRND